MNTRVGEASEFAAAARAVPLATIVARPSAAFTVKLPHPTPAIAPFAFLADGRPVYPLRGAARGYSTEGDIVPRVTQTADGQDLNQVWTDLQTVLEMYNEHRRTIVAHLSFPTVVSADAVAQTVGGESFEDASEFGIPQSARVPSEVLRLGYSFKDRDLSTRFTWKFLRDADTRQVDAVHSRVLEGDNRETAQAVLWRLLDPAQGVTTDNGGGAEGHPIYGLYNGDGIVPPPFMGKTFAAPHTHYMATAGNLDSSDIEALIRTITEHGYGQTPGSQLLLFAHPNQSAVITRIRAGDVSGDNSIAPWDFIPSKNAPAYLTAKTIVGERAPGEFEGLKIEGSLGPAWLTETYFMPAGYVLCVASGGVNNDLNPVGFRQHANVQYQGLRMIPGTQQRYPLVDSFYTRGYGTGVRHRGAAAVMQVTAAAVTTYTAPPKP